MKTIAALGTTWKVSRGSVIVYMVTVGRDGYSVAVRCRKEWGFRAVEATPDDCPPECPTDLVIVRVPVSRFDEFLRIVAKDMENEEHMIFPTVDAAWESELGETKYEGTPWGQAIGGLAA